MNFQELSHHIGRQIKYDKNESFKPNFTSEHFPNFILLYYSISFK